MKTIIYYAHRAYRSGSVVRHSQLVHSGRGSLFLQRAFWSLRWKTWAGVGWGDGALGKLTLSHAQGGWSLSPQLEWPDTSYRSFMWPRLLPNVVTGFQGQAPKSGLGGSCMILDPASEATKHQSVICSVVWSSPKLPPRFQWREHKSQWEECQSPCENSHVGRCWHLRKYKRTTFPNSWERNLSFSKLEDTWSDISPTHRKM